MVVAAGAAEAAEDAVAGSGAEKEIPVDGTVGAAGWANLNTGSATADAGAF